MNPPIYTGISASASMVPTTSNINAINSYNKTNFNQLYFLDYPDTYSNGAAHGIGGAFLFTGTLKNISVIGGMLLLM